MVKRFVNVIVLICYIIALDGTELIIEDDLQDWNVVGNTGHFIDINNCVQANQCHNLNNIASVSKRFSTVHYSDVHISFDVVINGWVSEVQNRNKGYISYSCSDRIIHNIFEYNSSHAYQQLMGNEYSFPKQCDNGYLTIYMNVYTLTVNRSMWISNIKLYGNYESCLPVNMVQIPIFYDDFNDYSINWRAIYLPITNNVGTNYSAFCVTPPCLQFRRNVIVESYPINTVGYYNISIVFDVHIGAERLYGQSAASEGFLISYDCGNGFTILAAYIGTGANKLERFTMGERHLLSQTCNNNTVVIKLENQAGQERSRVDNIYLFGNRFDGNDEYIVADNITACEPTNTPTNTPNKNISTTTIIPSVSNKRVKLNPKLMVPLILTLLCIIGMIIGLAYALAFQYKKYKKGLENINKTVEVVGIPGMPGMPGMPGIPDDLKTQGEYESNAMENVSYYMDVTKTN